MGFHHPWKIITTPSRHQKSDANIQVTGRSKQKKKTWKPKFGTRLFWFGRFLDLVLVGRGFWPFKKMEEELELQGCREVGFPTAKDDLQEKWSVSYLEDFLRRTWIRGSHVDVSKNRGKTPKMDGENNGKPLLEWMIWGYHYFWKHPCIRHFHDHLEGVGHNPILAGDNSDHPWLLTTETSTGRILQVVFCL